MRCSTYPATSNITTDDFRTIYHLAHRHALDRLFGNFRAGDLMRTGITPLLPDMPLDEAARALVKSGYDPDGGPMRTAVAGKLS